MQCSCVFVLSSLLTLLIISLSFYTFPFVLSLSRVRSEHTAQKTVESSVFTLAMYVDALMDAIFSSVSKCPSLLRLALRQLWLRVAEIFKDPEFVVR